MRSRTQYRTVSVIAILGKTGENNTFSEESKKTIQKWRKIELFAWREVSTEIVSVLCQVLPRRTVILHWRNMLEAFARTEAQDKGTIWIANPLLHCEKNYSRGAKYGRSQEQYGHFNANESMRHAKKKIFESITARFQKDELYRNSQSIFGFGHGNCFQIYAERAPAIWEQVLSRRQWSRSETWTNEEKGRFPPAVNNLLVLRRQVENPTPYIPKQLRFRQRPVEERERLEQQRKRWAWNDWSQSSSSSWAKWTTQLRQE